MATFQNIYDEVGEIVGIPSPSGQDLTNIKSAVNHIYQDILGRENWNFLETDYTASTVSGTQTYAIPTNLRKFIIIQYQGSGWTNWHTLTEVDIKTADINYNDTSTTGDPTYFWIWNSLIYLYAVPNYSGTNNFRGKYIRTVDNLSNASDTLIIPDRFRDVVINGTSWKVFANDDLDDVKADIYRNYYEAGIGRMRNECLNQTTGTKTVNFY